jgi:methionine-rich copper-binding protein CopC
MNRFFSLLAIGSAAALAIASPALAHTKLVSSSPAENATLATGPRTITLTFNERLVPAFSKFEVTIPGRGGAKVPVATVVSRDGKRIVGTLASPLGRGSYKVLWTAAGTDGHKMTGEVAFQVG